MPGPGKIRVREGVATVEIDQAEVIAQADRITKGALSTFLAAAHRQLDPIVDDARTDRLLWPHRTGESREATRVTERIRPDAAEVVALNDVPHTFKLRFSVVTSGTIDREAQQEAARVWGLLGPRIARVNASDKTQSHPSRSSGRQSFKGKSGAAARVAHHFMRTTRDPWPKWWPKEAPSEDALRRGLKRNLILRHGTGAPSEAMAGKHVWSVRVRKPARKAEGAVIEEARQALTTLAED